MSLALKKILALVVGMLVCVATVALIEQLNHALFIAPSDLPSQDPAAEHAYMQSLPLLAYCMVLLAWLTGTFSGITVASFMIKRVSRLFMPVISGMMLVSTLANFYLLPHPAWFMLASVVLIPVTGLLTNRWLKRRFSSAAY